MDDKNNSKKMWNRNQAAVFSILFPLVASIPIGLFYGLIFQTGEPLLKKMDYRFYRFLLVPRRVAFRWNTHISV